MEQNQNVCPCCGQPHEVAVKRVFLFREEWDSALELFAYHHCRMDRTHMGEDGDIYSVKSIYGNKLGSVKVDPIPAILLEWLRANPRPNLTRDQFIHQLGEQVAALAEKGGSR